MLEKLERKLLLPAELNFTDLDQALSLLCRRSPDFGDIYIQHTATESWQFDEGLLKDASYSSVLGSE